jgi:hypothetical protein
VEVTPAGVLSMWAAGLALSMAVVARWRIVGRGYIWLAGGVTLLFGVVAGAAGAGPAALIGCALVLVAATQAERPAVLAALAAAGAVALGVGSIAAGGGALATITGAVLLGAVTTEMMLGHWYLVDPRLPRPALRAFALAGTTAAVVDLGTVAALGAVPWGAADFALGAGFVLLLVTTAVLMVLVRSSLGEPGYSGVMAATGLSYLAVLTAAGGAVVGRMLA